MVFTDTKSPGDIIQSSDWNAFVDFVEELSGASYSFSGQSVGYFYPSTLGKGVSGQLQSHESDSSIHFTVESILDDFYPSSAGNNLGSQIVDLFSFSSNTGLYYPSSLGKQVSSQVLINTNDILSLFSFSTNTGVYYPSSLGRQVSSQLGNIGDLSGTSISRYFPSTLGTDLYLFSANAVGMYYPSSLGHSVGDISGTAVGRYFPSTLGRTLIDFSSNAKILFKASSSTTGGISAWYSLTPGIGIDAFGGNVAISGTQAETLAVSDYIASTSVITRFYLSSLGKDLSDQVSDLFLFSTNSKFLYKASSASTGGGISAWYDLSAGTGITPFNGKVSISGTQAETVIVADYIASTSVIQNYIPSATSLTLFYPSTLGTSLLAFSSNSSLYYPSSLGKQVSSQVGSFGDTDSSLLAFSSASVGYYYPSALGKQISSQVGNIGDLSGSSVGRYFPSTLGVALTSFSSNTVGMYYPSTLGVALASFSSNTGLYYPSTLGQGVSSQLHDIYPSALSKQVSSQVGNIGDLSGSAVGRYYPSALGVNISSNVLDLFNASSAFGIISGTYTSYSSNAMGLFYPSTLGKQVSSQVGTFADSIVSLASFSSASVGYYYPSALGKNISSQIVDLFNASSAHGYISSAYTSFSSNARVLYVPRDHFALSGVKDLNGFVSADWAGSGPQWNDTSKKWDPKSFTGGAGSYITQATADTLYYPSALGQGVSAQVSTFGDIDSSLLAFSSASVGYYYPSALGKGVSSQVHNIGDLSGSSVGRYYPSTLGANISSQLYTAYYPSAMGQNISSQLVDLFNASSAHGLISGAYTGFSSNIIGLYYPSALGKQVSSQVGFIGDLSGSAIGRYADSSNYSSHKANANAHHAQAHDIASHNWANDWMIIYSNDTGLVELPFNDASGKFLKSNGEAALTWSTAYAAESDLTAVLDDNYYPSTSGKNISSQVLDLYNASSSFGLISGAYTAFSSNAVGLFYPSSLGKAVSSQVGAIGDLSGSSIGRYYPSTLGQNMSSQLYTAYYPSAMGSNISSQVKDLYSASGAFGLISGAYTGYSSNAVGLFYPSTLGKGVSSQLGTYADITTSLFAYSTAAVGYYYPSALGKGVSSQVATFGDIDSSLQNFSSASWGYFYPSSLGQNISSQLYTAYYPSTMGRNISSQVLDLYSVSSAFGLISSAYTNFSSNSVGLFYPSSLGKQVSSQVGTFGDTDSALLAFSSASYGYFYPSALGRNISSQVSDLFNASSSAGLISGAYTGFSSNSMGLFYPSALGKQVSSQVGILGDISSSAIGRYYPSALGQNMSSQLYTAYYPSALGAGVSSQVEPLVLFSSNVINLYYRSSLGANLSSQITDLYSFSSLAKEYFKASSATVVGESAWITNGSDIFYPTGEVRIGASDFDLGSYNLQVSGDSYFSGSITFIGELSGIAAPTYNSGVANKKYVDDRVGGAIPGWYTLTPGTGINAFAGEVSISGTQAETLSVNDYIASTTVVTGYIPSATALANFYQSSIGQNMSSQLYVAYYPSAMGRNISSQIVDLFNASSAVGLISGTYTAFSSASVGLFYPSSLGKQISSQVGALGDVSSSAIGRYYPSTLGQNMSSQLYVAYYPSAMGQNLSSQIIDLFAASSAFGLISGAYTAYSSNAKHLYKGTGATTGGGISAWYDLSAGTGITAFAGKVAISGTQAEVISVADYIASTSIIELYMPSSKSLELFYSSSMGKSLLDFSSNSVGLYYPSALGKQVSSQVGVIGDLSSSAIGRYYPSAIGQNMSSQLYTASYPSSMGRNISSQVVDLFNASSAHGLISGAYTGFSSNIKAGTYNYTAISSSIISGGTIVTGDLSLYGDTISGLTIPLYPSAATSKAYVDARVSDISGNFYPSALGQNISSQLYTAFYPSAMGKNISSQVVDLFNASGAFGLISGAYSAFSSNSVGLYYPSTLGQNISSQLYVAYYPSAMGKNISSQVVDLFNASGAFGSISGAYTSFSSNIKAGTYVYTAISSSVISGGNIITNSFTLNANTISGLIDPTWPSAAASKHYVDTVSSNLRTKTLPMTFSVANVKIISGQNLNLTKFDAGSKNVYVWQAAACNSGSLPVSGLCIQLLSGSTSVYKTSSSVIVQGDPLARSDGGLTEIRFMYSGTHECGSQSTSLEYGTSFMQVSIY